jgi:hypothetical protein
MRRTISSFVCGFAVAAVAVTFSSPGLAAVVTENPAKPATGQQLEKYCNGLQEKIRGVLGVVNRSIAKVEESKIKSADKSFADRSLLELNAAVTSIGTLNGIIGNSKMTYALAVSVYGYMDEVTESLQRARWQIMASASNNQSTVARDAFNLISDAITNAQATGVQGGRCYMSPYVGG